MIPWLDTTQRLFTAPDDPAERPGRTGSIKDLGTITHASAFRRLAHKTQVFIDPDHDYVRTRLSHSLEASQIARELARYFCDAVPADWAPDERWEFENLAAHACLIHDIGHPPFGHLGERILQLTLDPAFEGNQQNVRIVFGLGFPDRALNLSRPLLDATIKYKAAGTKGPAYDSERAAVEENGRRIGTDGVRHPASYLMEAADDVAYLCGDLEDALKMNLLDDALRDVFAELRALFPRLGRGTLDAYRETPSDLTHELMPALIAQAKKALDAFAAQGRPTKEGLPAALHAFFRDRDPHFLYEGEPALKAIKRRIYHDGILKSETIAAEREAAEEILGELVADYRAEFRKPARAILDGVLADTLPHELRRALAAGRPFTEHQATVWLRDFIAGMTDRYATRLWNQLRLAK